MIRPGKDAEKFTLWLDPQCPPDKVYFQENTFFLHPNTFLDGQDWRTLVTNTRKEEEK